MGGGGGLTAKLLEEKDQAKLEFPKGVGGEVGGERVQNKTKPSVGGV